MLPRRSARDYGPNPNLQQSRVRKRTQNKDKKIKQTKNRNTPVAATALAVSDRSAVGDDREERPTLDVARVKLTRRGGGCQRKKTELMDLAKSTSCQKQEKKRTNKRTRSDYGRHVEMSTATTQGGKQQHRRQAQIMDTQSNTSTGDTRHI